MSSAIAPSAKETRRSRRRPAAGQRDMLDLTRNGGAPQRESSRGPDESDDMLWDPTTGPFHPLSAAHKHIRALFPVSVTVSLSLATMSA